MIKCNIRITSYITTRLWSKDTILLIQLKVSTVSESVIKKKNMQLGSCR